MVDYLIKRSSSGTLILPCLSRISANLWWLFSNVLVPYSLKIADVKAHRCESTLGPQTSLNAALTQTNHNNLLFIIPQGFSWQHCRPLAFNILHCSSWWCLKVVEVERCPNSSPWDITYRKANRLTTHWNTGYISLQATRSVGPDTYRWQDECMNLLCKLLVTFFFFVIWLNDEQTWSVTDFKHQQNQQQISSENDFGWVALI